MLKKCFLVFIFILIIVPIICFNHEKDVASDIDNRMLTELTDFKLETVNNYVNDRIGFREEAINIYNAINEKVFNVSTNPQLMIGKDNNIYPIVNSIPEFNDYHECFLNTIKNMQYYCEERGIEFYYMIEPSKATIMTDELPNGINFNSYWLDEFISKAKDMGINLVDNYNYFKEIDVKVPLYNKRYDSYHWNDDGAFYGINNLLNSIGVEENNLEDFTREKYPGAKDEDVYDLIADLKPEEYTDKYEEGLMMADDFKEFLYYKQNNNGPKLLSFEGSYLLTNDRTEKFIANHFSETIVVHDYQNVFNINYYLNIFKPDIVLFEMADYTFQEYYFARYYMETMQLQPALDADNIIQKSELQYSKEINGEYITYIIKNPDETFDYKYLIVDDDVYDLYKYDNENIALTILLENNFDINNVSVITKDKDSNASYSYTLK